MPESRIRPLEELREFLSGQQPGKLEKQNLDTLIKLLRVVWQELDGSDITNMSAEKLDRMENPSWRPPLLTFDIERHGATVLGSSRASLYSWSVNVDTATASILQERVRQLYPMSKRLNVVPIAAELARIILSGAESPLVKRYPDGSVAVNMQACVPTTYEQTTIARRKRLRKALQELLAPHGWQIGKAHRYFFASEEPRPH